MLVTTVATHEQCQLMGDGETEIHRLGDRATGAIGQLFAADIA